VRSRKKRTHTKAELQQMGATPGFMARRYDADGARARLEQLAPEGDGRRRSPLRSLRHLGSEERREPGS
jgi:hypothetical protein